MSRTDDPKFPAARLSASEALQRRLSELVPGGSHTYAKALDRFPEQFPIIIDRGKGCRVWDVDGNEYIEYGSGLRSVILGHGHPAVAEAVYRQALHGTSFSRPGAIECRAAEGLLRLIPSAEMVKFAKNGSDTTSAAVRLARAYTGRNRVAVCADHPFFSVDDWFIGSTPMDLGVPDEIKRLTVSFRYNDIESLSALFNRFPGQIACVLMEAERTTRPEAGFLAAVQRLCRANGALFVLDEIVTGIRYGMHGAQALHGLDPDLSTFGKAMGNGFAIAALVGKREFMHLGGIEHTGRRVFLMSTTHAAESVGLAACLETLKICEQEGVPEALQQKGQRLANGIGQVIADLRLEEYFGVAGRECCLSYWTADQNKEPSAEFQTLFLAELLSRGILAPNFVVNFAHTADCIDQTIDAVSEALVIYRRALDDGIEHHLVGRPVKPFLRACN